MLGFLLNKRPNNFSMRLLGNRKDTFLVLFGCKAQLWLGLDTNYSKGREIMNVDYIKSVRLALVFILPFLTACATAAGYQKIITTWLGQTESHLINSWGAPDNSYESEREYNGIGSRLSANTLGVGVFSLDAGMPAEKAGVLVGDLITHVDGESIIGLSLQDASKLIIGSPNTSVNLTIKREGYETPIDIKIIRKTVKIKEKHLTYNRSGPSITSVYSSLGVAVTEKIACSTTFTVAHGIITNFSFRGNGCKAIER